MSLDETLHELEKLEYNWDGRRSARPSRSAIEMIRNLTAIPLGVGAIQLMLHAGGADVEIEISDDGQIRSVMWSRAAG